MIQALGSAGFLTQFLGQAADLSTDSADSTAGFISGLLGILASSLGAGVLGLVVSAIVQGIVIVQVASSTLGTRLRLGALWGRLRGRRGAVIGWAVLSGAAIAVTIGIVVGLVILVGVSGGGSGGSSSATAVGLAVLVGFVLGAGLLVAFVWLWVKLGFVPAVIVLERASIARSMRRSWRLTRGAFWRTFGIRLLVAAMIGIAANIVTQPISILFSLGGTVLTPNGSTADGATQTLLLSLVATQAVSAVFAAVGLVVSSATTSLLYLDQRMRIEALDIDLARYVEFRQAGRPGLTDPYLPSPATVSP